MLPIAGQTARPFGLGLNFFADTQGWPGGLRLKNSTYLSNIFFQIFFPRATPGPLANMICRNQDIRIYVAYSRPNSWTDWAEIFCGHSWVAGGVIG